MSARSCGTGMENQKRKSPVIFLCAGSDEEIQVAWPPSSCVEVSLQNCTPWFCFQSGFIYVFFGHAAQHTGSQFLTRDQAIPPAVEGQILLPWTTREAPKDTSLGGLKPPTFRLTSKLTSQLSHRERAESGLPLSCTSRKALVKFTGLRKFKTQKPRPRVVIVIQSEMT